MSDSGESIESESVVVECDLCEPPEKVWRALTEPRLVAEWLLPNDAERVSCKVIEARPHRLLRYAWSDGGDVDSVVTFELQRTATDGTRLRVIHTGFSAIARDTVCMLKAA
ncbi:MAG: SRPBCC domain-containing protein [Gammaproteobacteria bacterium]